MRMEAKGPAAPCAAVRRQGGTVCLRFRSTAAPFTTPPKLKLTASSHVRMTIRANVYAAQRRACDRGLSTKKTFRQQRPLGRK